MRIECQLLPERGEVVTGGNFLVFDGLSRRAAFALEGDAELFVAADDLLGACEDVLEWLNTCMVDGVGFDEAQIIESLEQTIAKAQGAND